MADMIRIRVNVPMRGHAAGTELDIPAKPDGSPAELWWRRRLRDATRPEGGDGCVEIVAPRGVGSPASATVVAEAEPVVAERGE